MKDKAIESGISIETIDIVEDMAIENGITAETIADSINEHKEIIDVYAPDFNPAEFDIS